MGGRQRQAQRFYDVETAGRGFFDVTGLAARTVAAAGVVTGLCTVFCTHTSCGLLIQENASPDVKDDLLDWLSRLAPDGDPAYRHAAEGPDDMAAHLRSVLCRSSESIPVAAGRLVLGTWQSLYLVEHRTSPRKRRIIVHVSGIEAT